MLIPDFAEKLERLLKERGMTQAMLAEKAGITPRHLSYIKKGGPDISEKFMRKICTALGVPESEFMKETAEDFGLYFPVPLRAAGGGMGGGYHQGSRRILSYVSLRRDYLLTKTSSLDKLSFIHAAGDSMFPTIPPDAIVLIDESQVIPANNKIYYVLLDDVYLIKRLEVRNGRVTALISDNGNRRYELTGQHNLQILGKAILQQTEL